MATPLKFSLLMNSSGGSGWSESYYTSNFSTLELLDAYMPTVAGARISLMQNNTSVVGWRLTSTDPALARQSIVTTSIFTGGYQGSRGSPTAPEGNAWLANAKSANGMGRRQLWMRGIPSDWTPFATDGKTPNPASAFLMPGPTGRTSSEPLRSRFAPSTR